MAEHVNKTPDRKSQAAGYKTAQLQGGSGPGSGFVDKRAVGVMQRKLQEVADGSSRLSQLKDFQKMTVNRALTSQLNVFQQEGKWNSGNGTIQRMVNSDPSRMEEGLPSFYSDMDPTPSSPRYFKTSEEVEKWENELLEGEQLFNNLAENYYLNANELNKKGIQGIYGDPDLIKIYRENIQSNPAYKKLELNVRDIPLTIEWIDESAFGLSPSRARYYPSTNTIQVAKTLKGRTDTIIEVISFELQNAGTRHEFAEISKRLEQGTQKGVMDYEGTPMYDPNSKTPIFQQLATARWIVETERVEYQNVIQIEKAARLVGKKSAYSDFLCNGTQSRWSSFEKYLIDMCSQGHYIDHDPKVKDKTWNGWRFVKKSEKEDKDPLA